MTGIYTITSPSNKVYVGQSINLTKRIRRYVTAKCIGQHKILNSIKKYGWEAHKFEVIMQLQEGISQEWLNYWETFFWEYYKGQGIKMLNIKKPGSNGGHSEETKNRMSLKAKKRLSIPENNNFGKKHSEETRRKISLRHTGKKMSLERRVRMKEGHKKTLHSKKWSPVLQLTLNGEFIKEWKSISEAETNTEIPYQNISQCCRHYNNRRIAGGFKWEYKKQPVICL